MIRKIIQVEIIPKKWTICSKPIFTYEEEVDSWDLEKRIMLWVMIWGVNNFATIVYK